MSQTPTVAEQAAAPPPPEGSPSGEQRPARQPLAYLLTHQSGVVIVVALVIALLVGAALIRYQGVSPWYAYETLIREAIFVEGGLTRTLQKTAPLVLTGLAVVIPLRVGLFNIGGQGQLIFGAMFGAWAAHAAGGLGIVGALLGMLAGILAGAFIGWIAGVLKATRGVHEVITTIMLNYIAAGVT
jgi:general nucleoside transport system permease protein